MLKGLFSKHTLALSVFLFSFSAQAALSHISINSRHFKLDQHPQLKLNIVAANDDLSRLSFHLRQTVGANEVVEELMLQPVSRFMLYAIGVDDVSDPNAKLIVSEYKGNSWQQYAVLSVFDAPYIKPNGRSDIKIDAAKALKKVPLAATTAEKDPIIVTASNNSNNSQACMVERNNTETLWGIASRYATSWNTHVYGAMLALYEANPQAFSQQKIHLIKQDVPLRCPTKVQLNQYITKADAKLEFESIEAKHRSQ
ncbi:FimV/HubP family polar landmark protein [Pseudomonadota bacterium]